MTESEKQQIVSLVLQSLKTNSLTIEQLTDTTELARDMYVEVSGSRKVSIELLVNSIATMVNGDFDELVRNVNKIAKDLKDGDDELLKRITGTSEKSVPLTDPFKNIGTFTTINGFNDILNLMYLGDSSIGNYRGVLAVEASKIPVNIQVERINLNKVVQSFTSCIQLKTMQDGADTLYLGTVCTISRMGNVSGGNVTWDEWTTEVESLKGSSSGIAPLDENKKVPYANLPIGEEENELFPGNRGKDLETKVENLPDSVVDSDSIIINPLESTVDIEYRTKSKDGKITDGKKTIPAATEQKAGVMTAEDKKILNKVKDGGGSGSGFYDVTRLHPLEEGYYTLSSAVPALKDAEIADNKKAGLIITFEVSSGK